MIIHIPMVSFQKAVTALLKGKLSVPIYDCVPKEARLPYVTIGDFTAEPDGAKLIDISNVTLELYVWSQYPGKKEINEISESIVSVYTSNRLDLSADGFLVLSQWYESVRTQPKEEGGYVATVTISAKIQY